MPFFKLVPLAFLGLATAATYKNPVLNTVGADPYVVQHEGYYYMTYGNTPGPTNITMLRTKQLTDWNNAEAKVLFNPPPDEKKPYSTDLWAPEIHLINNKWYVIFSGDPNKDSPDPALDAKCDFSCPAVNHRMNVLESSGSDPWESELHIQSHAQHLRPVRNRRHLLRPQNRAVPNLLVLMKNPWTVESTLKQRTIISKPDEPWEKTPYNRTINVRLSSNEGPEQLTNSKTGQQFVIYSAGRSDTSTYCLGQLELVGEDPMKVESWRKHKEGCVFESNVQEHAVGVGHASFTKSPDGKEDWIVYHGYRDASKGWQGRTIRTQKFEWNADGTPKFPKPGYGPYEVPSGQK